MLHWPQRPFRRIGAWQRACLVVLACTMAAGAHAQMRLQPTLGQRNPIDPDSLHAFERFAEAYDAVEALEFPWDSLERAQQDLILQEKRRATPPWSTEPFGCSFYCAVSPERLSSSSALREGGSLVHDANRVHDFDLRTAWVEGAEGDGIGESLSMRIPLNRGMFVTRILIHNGYAKDAKTWQDNGRVKALAIHANGRPVAVLELLDDPREQAFAVGMLGPASGSFLDLEFKILEVYPGARFPDTAISEINVDGIGDH